LRRFLDRLYDGAAAAAALCLAAIAAVMLAQAAMRELGMLFRGADDIVAWLCAAAAFLALGHTFRRGELVRIGVLIERLPQAARRKVGLAALAIALAFVAYMLYAVTRFVY
jgi:TRAP-type C4-dicarboxylate transport system permease small subunit